MWVVDRVILCPVVWSKPFSSGIGLPLFIYNVTGMEVHFPGSCTPPSLRQRLGLPSICAFSLCHLFQPWWVCTPASWFTAVATVALNGASTPLSIFGQRPFNRSSPALKHDEPQVVLQSDSDHKLTFPMLTDEINQVRKWRYFCNQMWRPLMARR